MPITLPRIVTRALSDAKLTSEEVTQLRGAVSRGEVTAEQLRLISQRYGDLFTTGAGQALVAIAPAGGNVAVSAPVRSLGDSRAAAEVLNGTATLSRGSKHPAVLPYQHALNALASRLEKPEWALLGSGADGVYGKESVAAVTAFQHDNGLPETGNIDRATAQKMEELLYTTPAPDIGGVTGRSSLPDGDRIAQAARDIIATRASDYGTAATWRSPNPAVPNNANPGVTGLGAADRWKCNLFGLDSIYAGGAQTPHYPGGNYPIALEIPNYSRGPNAPLIKLAEVWTNQGTPEDVQARVEQLMRIARPGDLIIVNHQGKDIADGGHTRLVVANNFAKDGTVDCAQARADEARVLPETVGSFTGEEAVYLLRPAQRQPAAATDLTAQAPGAGRRPPA